MATLIELVRLLRWPVAITYTVWSVGHHITLSITAQYEQEEDD